MAVIIQGNGGGGFGGLFPSEYPKMKSTAIDGGTFPGWDADIIPICISTSASTYKNFDAPAGTTNQGTISGSRTINGKTVASVSSGSITCTNPTGTTAVRIPNINSNAYSIFLPYFYDFDFDAIKNAKSSIRSIATACTVWLER